MPEHEEQVALMQMCQSDERLKWLYAIPNGGARDVRTGVKMKAEGVKRGVADLFLPYPVGEWHGCYIEMKFGKNKVTDEQEAFLEYVHDKGYYTAVCYSAEEAYEVLTAYVDGVL